MQLEKTQSQQIRAIKARQELVRWITLWHFFLVLSPSYELARRFRVGELEGAETLPDDFDTVLSVYDDLGAVSFNQFSVWWQDVRFRYFGFGGDKRPAIECLGIVNERTDDAALSAICSSVKSYHSHQWTEQGQPSALIAAIPVGLTKSQILRQLSDQLDAIPDGSLFSKRAMNAKYVLTGSKLHRDPVVRYRDCLLAKGRMPDAPLWRIGAAARVSNTYNERLKPQVARTYSHDEQMADREAVKFLTGRAVKRGHMIAENAARGIFPSYAKCQHAMPLDLERVEKQRLELVAATMRRKTS